MPLPSRFTRKMRTPQIQNKDGAPDTEQKIVPVHTGGGWYDVGDERVQGREAAKERAAELNNA